MVLWKGVDDKSVTRGRGCVFEREGLWLEKRGAGRKAGGGAIPRMGDGGMDARAARVRNAGEDADAVREGVVGRACSCELAPLEFSASENEVVSRRASRLLLLTGVWARMVLSWLPSLRRSSELNRDSIAQMALDFSMSNSCSWRFDKVEDMEGKVECVKMERETLENEGERERMMGRVLMLDDRDNEGTLEAEGVLQENESVSGDGRGVV